MLWHLLASHLAFGKKKGSFCVDFFFFTPTPASEAKQTPFAFKRLPVGFGRLLAALSGSALSRAKAARLRHERKKPRTSQAQVGDVPGTRLRFGGGTWEQPATTPSAALAICWGRLRAGLVPRRWTGAQLLSPGWQQRLQDAQRHLLQSTRQTLTQEYA